MKNRLLLLSIALVGISILGCGSGSTEETTKKEESAPASASKEAAPSAPVAAGFAAVQAVLTKNCANCHSGPDAKEGVKLTSYEEVMAGGEHGPIVKAGDPEASLLYKVISGAPGVKKMPPKAPLSTDEIALIADWIKAGAAKS